MKNTVNIQVSRRARKSAGGFSLVEMMIAVAVFLIIGGAAINLVSKHAPLASSAQNQLGLNMALRNAIAQMEVDVANAGTGYYPGANIATWPIGVTIVNAPQAAACNTAANFRYGANCFDTLNVIAADPNTPPSHPQDIGANCVSTTSSNLFTVPIGTETLADLASHFKSGDQLLVIKSDGSQMTTTTLTADGQVTGGKVKLQHNPTGADGTSGDPFNITTAANLNKLGIQFCETDWVLKLNPITYRVDLTNPDDPKLVRQQSGNTDVIAEQVIGFRVGASVRVGTADQPYNFNSAGTSAADGCTSNCGYEDDWSQIRAVRISLLGRTPPNADLTSRYQNSFDGGPYKIQGVSVTINPRNLSMSDQTN